ncbi:MAG: threonylcarbamoyl-AMP synthase [Balneolaceae bacterium]|nr:MAG: threonylcarbamoyl-AMP synthase [Balneolaceae bacterium]
MAQKIKLHPETPHQKRVFDIVDMLNSGSVMLFPTDSKYALGCEFSNKKGLDRIRSIRRVDKDHLFTLLCDSLSGLARFAHISDNNFKIIKRLIPGPFTFILPATKEVPKLMVHPSRKTVGFRVPDSPICLSILTELGSPIMATTAKHQESGGNDVEVNNPDDLFHIYDKLVDLVIDDEQPLNPESSTVIDMTGDTAVIIRPGLGIGRVEEAFALQNLEFEYS